LTEKIDPVRSFVIENSWPAEPSNDSVPFEVGYVWTVMAVLTELFAPRNSIFGSAVLALFGVMIISL
jgi:hypothetical protein